MVNRLLLEKLKNAHLRRSARAICANAICNGADLSTTSCSAYPDLISHSPKALMAAAAAVANAPTGNAPLCAAPCVASAAAPMRSPRELPQSPRELPHTVEVASPQTARSALPREILPREQWEAALPHREELPPPQELSLTQQQEFAPHQGGGGAEGGEGRGGQGALCGDGSGERWYDARASSIAAADGSIAAAYGRSAGGCPISLYAGDRR